MESKVVSLDVIPGHPKFLRLPSVSRSLIHSILPKACHEMHLKPKVFSITNKPLMIDGAPVLTPRKDRTKKRKKRENESFLGRAENVRPCSNSYIYRKIFENKAVTQREFKQYYSPRVHKTQKPICLKTFYCEVQSNKARTRARKRAPASLNTTQILFVQNQGNNLHFIPEVQSNMESSEFNLESMSNFLDF